MKENKYRAWDKDLKEMFYLDRGHFMIGRTGQACMFCNEWLDKLIKGGFVRKKEGGHKPKILMQFTGLLDKNGKDLDWWEGDIFARSSDGQIIGTIIDDLGCFWLDGIRGGRNLLYECVDWSMYKVGNIFENKDLLEETK